MRWPVVLGTLVALTLAVLFTCLTKVRLHEVGVKVNVLKGGIAQTDYPPGYYFLVPGVEKMYRLDPTIQTFQWGGTDKMEEALRPRAKDEYITQFDITILYRIRPGEAHKLVEQVGLDPARIREFVKSKSRQALWDVLGQYRTEDFYNVDKREEARARAKKQLSAMLARRNLELIDILIRDIQYDPKFEEVLVKKQLLDQQRALNIEKARLERELEKTQSIQRETEAKVRVIEEEKVQEVANIEAETEAKVQEILADAELKAQALLAEAEQYRRTKVAEGERLRAEARAKGEKAMNEAYLADGGELYIARQLIESLEFGDIEINTNRVNPFDVRELLQMLGLGPTKLGPPPGGDGSQSQ